MVWRGIIVSSILVLCYSASAQSQPDSIRSKHIKEFSDYFFIGAVLKQRNLNFRITSRLKPSETYFFKPNTSYSTGVTLNIFDVGLEVSWSIPINVKNQERYGSSSVLDLQTSAQGNQWTADAYLQKYAGFYVHTPGIQIKPGQSYEHRSDLKADNFGVSFTYIFNHRKFSLRSAYSFTEQQRSNAGSFLFSYVLSSFNLSADSALVPSTQWKNVGEGSATKNIKFTSLGIAPGYSYNFVHKNYFLNATVAVGPAHYWIQYQYLNEVTHYDIRINLYSALRFGIGYNGERLFYGVSYSTQGRNVRFEQIDFKNSIETFRLVVGYRFVERGILKKTPMDAVPKKYRR
jgi:hypothetical protein